MKFDVSRLKEINELDFEQVAFWPFEVKSVVALFVAIIVGALSYYVIIKPKLPILDSAQQEEAKLKSQFSAKHNLAVNLEAYNEQLSQIKTDFSTMLKSLPTKNETPGLLDDITYVGTSAGLNFNKLNWKSEVPKEFYSELPIEIEVSGRYHEFGEFVSNLAKLSRIVTLHDFDIEAKEGNLLFQLQAKTYRTANTDIQQELEQ